LEPLPLDSKLLFGLGGWRRAESGLGLGEIGLGGNKIRSYSKRLLELINCVIQFCAFSEVIVRLIIIRIDIQRPLKMIDGFIRHNGRRMVCR